MFDSFFRCISVFFLLPMVVSACDTSTSEPDPFSLSGRDSSLLIDEFDAGAGVDPETGLSFLDTDSDETESSTPSAAQQSDVNVRSCPTGCGVQQQVNGQWSNCVAGRERCNRHDDDCDNQLDEGFNVGALCSTSQANGCTAQGQLACNQDGVNVDCDAAPTSPTTETCDGIDNDCDGEPDEDYPGQFCCTEDYQCPGGSNCENGRCNDPPTGGNGGGGGGNGPFLSIGLGGACNGNIECQSVACVGNVCVGTCMDDAECPANQICEPANPALLNGLDAVFPPDICQPGQRNNAGNNNPPADIGNAGNGGNGSSCIEAILIEELGSYQDSTMNANNDLEALCGNDGAGPERVFTYQSPVQRSIVIDTNGSDFDTVLSIRTQCESAATEIGCDDDGGQGTQSLIPLEVEANTTYYIVVHGFGRNARGRITLNVNELR